MTAYDDQNVFAKILRGEIPCFKVHENERAFAFLDIMPRSPGHTLVIPKAPARGILDIAEDDLAEVVRSAKRIAIAAMKAGIELLPPQTRKEDPAVLSDHARRMIAALGG